ncbi:MAG TPA: patatin-like phospholipase family protein, partial [Pyrinomonadaceae bacterium]|nr:patatin-like phospholipase family protein [Pyrinomonadaceae bacterium]
MADNPPLPLYRVLIQEYNAQRGHLPAAERLDESVYDTQYETLKQSYRARLHDSEEAAKRANADLVKMFYARMRGDGVKRSALCFSGGGIRSATFGLGVLQGLSRRGLLSEFDYLSTVSGGGYLGGWLSAWIHRHGLYAVQEGLRNQATAKKSPLNPEPEPIRHLRSYSRYMSPKLGLLSADTWTLAAIYFRNLLLNWIVLLPLIMAAMMLPRLALWAISPHVRAALKTNSWGGTLSQLAFWGAVAFGAYAVAYIYANRPSYGEPALYGGVKKRASVFPEPRKRQTIFLAECLTPLILLAILITTYYAWIDVPLGDMEFDFLGRSLHWPAPVAFVVFGVLLNVVGWLIAFLWIRVFGISELLIAAATGALGGFLTWAITYVFFPDPLTLQSSAIYVCVAMPLFLLLFLLAATVFVGLSSYRTTDNDREWLARCGAWMLIACAVWSVVSALVIFGPVLFAALGPKMRTTLASVSGISGLLTLVFGRSGKSPANSKEEQKGGLLAGAGNLSLSLAAAIFSAAAIVLLSIITTWLINKIGVNLSPTLAGRGLIDAPMRDYWYATGSFLPYDPLGQLNFLEASPLWLLVPLTLLLVVLGGVAGLFININKFSLHAAYRDRLVRAYLGASRDESERKPNPFTGLDENDNLPMDALRNQYFCDEYSFSN